MSQMEKFRELRATTRTRHINIATAVERYTYGHCAGILISEFIAWARNYLLHRPEPYVSIRYRNVHKTHTKFSIHSSVYGECIFFRNILYQMTI